MSSGGLVAQAETSNITVPIQWPQVDDFKWGIQVLNLTSVLHSLPTWCCNIGLATSAIHLITMVPRVVAKGLSMYLLP